MAEIINGLFPGKILPSITVAGCVEIYENAWPNYLSTITAVEERIQSPDSDIRWEKATTVGLGQDQEIRTNKHLNITDCAKRNNDIVFQNIHNQFNMLLLATTIGYNERFFVNEPFWHEEYNLLKYRINTQYHRHYDGATASGRCVSAICYLNNDYEGGELEFPNFGIKIKPEPGMLMLFPSNFAYAHVAHPVKSGTKYAIVTWIRDRGDARI